MGTVGSSNSGGSGGGGSTNITNTILAADAAGVYRVGQRHQPAGPQPLPATVITGFDFNQILIDHPHSFLRVKIIDEIGFNRAWPVADVDISALITNEDTGSNSAFIHIFDNDWVPIDVVDASTGELTFGEMGRQVQYCYSEVLAYSEILQTATSNYQDIGNTRIQWGSQASDGVVVLPMPFADTNYSVTTANSFTTAGRTSQILNNSKTTTQFTIRAFSGNAQSATGCNWQAIGVKP